MSTANSKRGVAVSVWSDIDALKAKFDAEFSKTRTLLHDSYGKREANSLKILDGGLWRVLHDGHEYTSRTSAGLLEQLPKPKAKR